MMISELQRSFLLRWWIDNEGFLFGWAGQSGSTVSIAPHSVRLGENIFQRNRMAISAGIPGLRLARHCPLDSG
jgi:hypothetical protein